MRRAPLAVTVSAKQPGRYAELARLKAAAWGVPFVERLAKTPLEPLLEQVADAFLVLGGNGWALHDAGGVLEFSPGMAQVRIKRLLSHDARNDDLLLRLTGLAAGDSVLDCTLGLAADALVCAHRAGEAGRVVGVEASLPLFALVSEGLAARGSRIEVRHGRALDVLRAEASGSFDCVIIDPMFDRPRRASPAFELLRRHAVHEPLDELTLHEARRVARRCVVVKGSRHGHDFRRLGLVAEPLKHVGPLLWAKLNPLK